MTDDEKDRYIEEQDRVIDQLTVRVIELQELLERAEDAYTDLYWDK